MQHRAIALPIRAEQARARAASALLVAALLLTAMPAAQALGDLIKVIVVAGSADDAARLTERSDGRVTYELPIVDGVAAQVPSSRLPALEADALVYQDRAIRMQGADYGDGLASAYPHEVGGVSLWDDGVTGDDVTVALVDTGVAEVEDLEDRVVATANFTAEKTHEDTYGHGTFQAGLIAGTGESSDGRYVGVAPEADLLSVKVAGADGSTSLAQVLAGVQLVDQSADRFDVRVLLLAVDSESPLPPDLDPLSWALRTLWSHGVVVVVPAGNGGPDAETIASPGEDPWLLTAGSVDDLGTPNVDDDLPADSTARGPTRWGDPKPDLAAPGEHLVSVRAPGSTIDREHASARVEGDYFKGSGTSMAAAVTAGAAALLLSEHPDLEPDEVKALLTATAAGIAAGDAESTGAGVVDAAAAVAVDEDVLPDLPDADELPAFGPRWLKGDWDEDDDDIERYDARKWIKKWLHNDNWFDKFDDEWEARQWRARQWRARQWHARQWYARQWAARQWRARQWSDERWEARQWAARQWTARQWSARQWSARQWTDEGWLARQWSARQWSDEEWLARQWSARQWSARQWNARQWSARQWSARQWSADGWG